MSEYYLKRCYNIFKKGEYKMYYLDLKERAIIIFKSFVSALFIVLPILGFIFLVKANFDFSDYVCNITKIPRDLTLTVMSLGFRNNMVVVLTVLELLIFCYIFGMIKKTKIYIKFYEIFVNS